MSGRREGVTETPHQPIATQATAFARDAMGGRRGLAVLAGLSVVVGAGLIAPGHSPGIWVWVRVLAIAILVSLSLSTIAAVRDGSWRSEAISPVIIWGSLLLALSFSLSFSVLTATIAAITLVLLLLHLSAAANDNGTVFWALVATLVPLWVWSAFDAWDRWLLMLVPVAAIGIVSLEHGLRADLVDDGSRERLAAWIGVVAIGAILLLTTLLTRIDASWVIGGNVIVAALVLIDTFMIGHVQRKRIPSAGLPVVALVILIFSWLIAL